MAVTLQRGNPMFDRFDGRFHGTERQWRTFPRQSVGTIKNLLLGVWGRSPQFKWLCRRHSFCLVFRVFHLSTGINYKENIFKALILLGGSYCTYSFVFRRKRVQVLHLLKFLPVVVHNFAAARHVLR
jgi:hypothetical protein